MRFFGCCGLRFACGCLHPYLSAPRVSNETFATARRIRSRRSLAWIEILKEKSFLLPRLFVAAARGFHRVALGHFCDRDVPPGLVAGDPLVVGSFDHDD